MGGASRSSLPPGRCAAAAGSEEQVLSVEVDMTATTSLAGDLPRPARPPAAPGPGVTAPARSRLRVRAPELAGRGWLNTGGARPHPGRPARPDRRPGLLDLLLRQLPARPRRAAPARGAVRRLAGPDRGALARSSSTRPTRTRWPPLSSAMPCTTRCSTTPTSSPGRPTPPGPGPRWWSSTPRATSSPPCRVRATRTGSSVLIDELVAGAHGQGHAAPRRRAVRAGRPGRARRCASPARRPRCRTGPSSSPTPRTTSWSTSRPTW